MDGSCVNSINLLMGNYSLGVGGVLFFYIRLLLLILQINVCTLILTVSVYLYLCFAFELPCGLNSSVLARMPSFLLTVLRSVLGVISSATGSCFMTSTEQLLHRIQYLRIFYFAVLF